MSERTFPPVFGPADILLPNGATTHLTVLKIVRTHH